MRVFRNPNNSSRHISLEFFTGCKKCSWWTSIKHRNSKALTTSKSNICSPFTWRCQKHQSHQISSYSYFTIFRMGFFNKFTIVFNTSITVRILNNCSKIFTIKYSFFVISNFDRYCCMSHTRTKNSKCLRKYIFINK